MSPCCVKQAPGRSHVAASEVRCAQVRSYKYTSPKDTIFESLFLHRFWSFLVHACVPRWMAPNLLTALGLVSALIAYALLLAYSPALEGDAPSWVYVVCAALLFVYQTMDGMDGKQARRMGAGSPLGEVVDHGADAIVACVYGVFICDAFGIGFGGDADGGGGGFGGRWTAVALITYSRMTFLIDTVTATYTVGAERGVSGMGLFSFFSIFFFFGLKRHSIHKLMMMMMMMKPRPAPKKRADLIKFL